jgi:hypothetical protein
MKIKAIILAVMLSFCMTACDNSEPDDSSEFPSEYVTSVLESGFIQQISYGCDPASTYFAAYRSDKTEFLVDDVTLSFSFGDSFADIEQGHSDETEVHIKVFFLTGERNSWRYTYIKELEDFYGEAYKCNFVKINKYWSKAVFNYSEDITVPAELFTGERGRIDFGITEYIVWNNGREPEYGSGTAVAIYYKVIGQTVRLSSEEITD